MPAQAVTPGARWKAILGTFQPALVSLDNVVHLPVTPRLVNPASVLEDDWVATEVTVACRLVKNASQGCFCHHYLMIAQGRQVGLIASAGCAQAVFGNRAEGAGLASRQAVDGLDRGLDQSLRLLCELTDQRVRPPGSPRGGKAGYI